jgi:hypothetical protein
MAMSEEAEIRATLARLRRLSHTLDNAFTLPVVNYRVGWDAIIGLVPGIGDAITLLPSGYLIYQAHRLGTPRHLLVKMIINVGLEALIGTIPLIGDIFDAVWKANERNLALLERHLGMSESAKPSNAGPLLVLGVLAFISGSVVWALWWLFQAIGVRVS